jgi:hypothetical protein
MKLRTFFILIISLLLFQGCSWLKSDPKAEARSNPNYSFEKNGIRLFIRSSKNLNLVNNERYTLALIIVQVNSAKAANTLLSKEDVLSDLLIGKAVNDPTILATDRLSISPEANEWAPLVRRSDTQSIVIYAGYFNTSLDKKVRQFSIPIEVDSTGYVFKSYTANAAPLKLFVDLADKSINEIRVIDKKDDFEPPKDSSSKGSKSDKKSNNPPYTTNKVQII